MIDVLLSRLGERSIIVLRNPFDGSARLYVALEDDFGGKYDIDAHVVPIVYRHFSAATLTKSLGLWKRRRPEDTVLITVIAYHRSTRPDVVRRSWGKFAEEIRRMASEFKREFRQKAVMVEMVPPGAAAHGFR